MKLSYRNVKNAEAVSRFWGKPLDKPDWFSVKDLADGAVEILIYDAIGWPYIDANELIHIIDGFKEKDLLVRINSPGGDVFDGTAIFNALANHPAKVTTRVEGLAASMASVLAMAGKEVQAYSNTWMMIHEPWVIAMGNHYDLREIADLLEKIGGNLLDIYTGKTKSGKKEMKQMMADETWMTAAEAEKKGFVDTVLASGKAAKAQFDLSMFAKVPEGVATTKAGRDLTERDVDHISAKVFEKMRNRDISGMSDVLVKTIKVLGT